VFGEPVCGLAVVQGVNRMQGDVGAHFIAGHSIPACGEEMCLLSSYGVDVVQGVRRVQGDVGAHIVSEHMPNV